MTDDIPWLVQEITDLLDAGQVGVYEFVEAARQRYPGASVADMLPICRPAFDQVLRDDRVGLGWYVWPGSEPIRSASAEDVTDAAFEAIGPGPYLGLERV
jgi:hypothetical protein